MLALTLHPSFAAECLHESAKHKKKSASHLEAQVEEIYVYKIVYSGNKTHNTGMDQVVPWCNL